MKRYFTLACLLPLALHAHTLPSGEPGRADYKHANLQPRRVRAGHRRAGAANYFAGNATVSSNTNGTIFVLKAAAYINASAVPITTAYATTVNHGYQVFHYDLAGAELGTPTKLRFRATACHSLAPVWRATRG